MENKAILILNISPCLEDFVRHELTKTDHDGNIILTRHSDIGKIIYSNLVSGGVKRECPEMENPVKFVIPRNPQNHYLLQYRFCYIDRWGEQKINDYLEAEFRQRIRLIFEAGYQKKCTQKQIIEAILLEYNIKNCTLNYETIKKSDYRNQRKLRKSMMDTLQLIVY